MLNIFIALFIPIFCTLIVPIIIHFAFKYKRNYVLQNIEKEFGIKKYTNYNEGEYKGYKIRIDYSLFQNMKIKITNLNLKNQININTKSQFMQLTFKQSIEKNELMTGDNLFDKIFDISDNVKTYLGYFTKEVRSLFRKIINLDENSYNTNNRVNIKDNIFNYDVIVTSQTVVNKAIHNIFSILGNLSTDLKPEELLLKNIDSDSLLNVKINNLKVLLDSQNFVKYKNNIKQLLNNKNHTISFLAAKFFKEDGIPTLINLLKYDNVKLELIDELSKYIDKKDVINTLIQKLNATDNQRILTKIFTILSNIQDEKVHEELENFIFKQQDFIHSNSLKIKILSYIEERKSFKYFSWIIKMLKEDKEIKIHTIKALKILDDKKAIEFLLPLTKGLNSPEIKYYAKDAIKYLQRNITDEDTGTLSLLETEAGNLSVANNNQGDLSLEDEIK